VRGRHSGTTELTPSAVGGLAIAGGVGSLIYHSFSSIIIGIYEIMYVSYKEIWSDRYSAGALIIFLEVRTPTEQQKTLVHQYASFMHSFIGRGVGE
jgi:hypothetical protein